MSDGENELTEKERRSFLAATAAFQRFCESEGIEVDLEEVLAGPGEGELSIDQIRFMWFFLVERNIKLICDMTEALRPTVKN